MRLQDLDSLKNIEPKRQHKANRIFQIKSGVGGSECYQKRKASQRLELLGRSKLGVSRANALGYGNDV